MSKDKKNPIVLALQWPETVLMDFTQVFCQELGCELGVLILPQKVRNTVLHCLAGHFNLDEGTQEQLTDLSIDPEQERLFRSAFTRGGLWSGHGAQFGPFEQVLQTTCHLETLVCGVVELPEGEQGLMYAGSKTRLSLDDLQKMGAAQVLQSLTMGFEMQRTRQVAEVEQKTLQVLIETTDNLVAEVKDGRWVTLNPAFQQVLGYTLDDLKDQFVVEILDGNEDAVVAMQRAMQGEFRGATFRFLHKDGSQRHIKWTGQPDASGGLMLIGKDITEQLGKQERIKKLWKRNREVADRSDLFLYAAVDWGIGYYNQSLLAYFGYQDLSELDWMKIVHPEEVQRVLDLNVLHHEVQSPFEMRLRMRRKDGIYRHVLGLSLPVHTDDGEFLGFQGFFYDVHEETMLKLGLNPEDSA